MKRYLRSTLFAVLILMFALSLCACSLIGDLADKIKGDDGNDEINDGGNADVGGAEENIIPQLTDVEKVNESLGFLLALFGEVDSRSGVDELSKMNVNDMLSELRKLDFSVEDTLIDGVADSSSKLVVKDGMLSYIDTDSGGVVKLYDAGFFSASYENGDVVCNNLLIDTVTDDGDMASLSVDMAAIKSVLLLEDGDLEKTEVDGIYELSRGYLIDLLKVIFPDGISDEIEDELSDFSFLIDVSEYNQKRRVRFFFNHDDSDKDLIFYTTVSKEEGKTVFTVDPRVKEIKSANIKATFTDNDPESLEIKLVLATDNENGSSNMQELSANLKYRDRYICEIEASLDVTEGGDTNKIRLNYTADKKTVDAVTEESITLEFSIDKDKSDGISIEVSGTERYDASEIIGLAFALDVKAAGSVSEFEFEFDTKAIKTVGGKVGSLKFTPDTSDNFHISAEIVTEAYSENEKRYSVTAIAKDSKESSSIECKIYSPAKSEHEIIGKVNNYLQNADKIYGDYEDTKLSIAIIENDIIERYANKKYDGLYTKMSYYDKADDIYYLIELRYDDAEDNYYPVVTPMADGIRYAYAYPQFTDRGVSSPLYINLANEIVRIIRADMQRAGCGLLEGNYIVYEYVPEYDVYLYLVNGIASGAGVAITRPTAEEYGLPVHEVKRDENGATVHENIKKGLDSSCHVIYYCEDCGIKRQTDEVSHEIQTLATGKDASGKVNWELKHCSRCLNEAELYIFNAGPEPVVVFLERFNDSMLNDIRKNYDYSKLYVEDPLHAFVISGIYCTGSDFTDNKYNIVIPDLSECSEYKIVGAIHKSGAKSYSPYASLTLPKTLIFIGEKAFYENEFSAITLPESLIYIGKSAFGTLFYVKKLVIPENVGIIEDGAIDSAVLETLIIKSSALKYLPILYTPSLTEFVLDAPALTEFGGFAKCAISVFVVPEGILTAPMMSFNENLKKVVLPDSVRMIPADYLHGCTALEEVVLGNNIISIEQSAFSGCVSLRKVYPSSMVNKATDGTVLIPYSVDRIGDYAFRGCTSLKHVIIPASLRRLDHMAFAETALDSITFGCVYRFSLTITAKTVNYENGATEPLLFGTEETNIKTKGLREGIAIGRVIPSGSVVNYAGTLEEFIAVGYVFDDTVTVNCEVEFE